jgi:hypothetical protein
MKNDIDFKNTLTIEEVFTYVTYLGGEPVMYNNYFVSRTICHNPVGEGSYKLYYYDNSHLFKCYTDCPEDSFDIFQLTMKVKKMELPQAISFVKKYYGFSTTWQSSFLNSNLKDWEVFERYSAAEEIPKQQTIELTYFNEDIINHFPKVTIPSWKNEGITQEVMDKHNLRYDPIRHGVIIPHYDINGELIGIRERTLAAEYEAFGKYRPCLFNNILYSHPLGCNLYDLNIAKDNIKIIKKAIIAEGEKSTMQYSSFFGMENNICVACCGSSIISHQIELLLSLGVQEIIVALDKQFKEVGDAEWEKLVKNYYSIKNRYGQYTQISYLFDKSDMLDYKDSPFDKGKETFLKLYNERIVI